MESTRRRASWQVVNPGATVSVPVEGGYVAEKTAEGGVLFKVEGQDGVFVPQSMVVDVMRRLAEIAKRGRRGP
jgi:hypothetical protein